MSRFRELAIFLAASGCAGNTVAPSDEVTRYSYLVQLDHQPSADDSVRAMQLGGIEIVLLPLANSMLLKAVDNGYQFKTIDGCQYVLFLTSTEQSGMVVITYRSQITAGELALVTSLASGAPTQDSTGTSLRAWLVFKTINRLQGDTNILSVQIDPHLYFPKQATLAPLKPHFARLHL